VRNCDLVRRRVLVVDNAVMVGTTVVVGTPKSHKSRSVPIPAFLNSELSVSLAGSPIPHTSSAPERPPCDSPTRRMAGSPARFGVLRRSMRPFPRVTPHDLRHSAASLAASAAPTSKRCSGCSVTLGRVDQEGAGVASRRELRGRMGV
jgi:integrase